MANYTDNLNLILPGDDDYALVQNLTDDFQAIDDFAGDVVKVYDPTITHSKREYCIYQNHLYKCNAFINTPEAFDPSHWDRVILGDEVRNNYSYISNMQSGLAIVQDGDTATKAITEGQYVCWKGSMRYAKANIAIGETFSGTNLGLLTTYNGALNKLSDQIVPLKLYPEAATFITGSNKKITITFAIISATEFYEIEYIGQDSSDECLVMYARTNSSNNTVRDPMIIFKGADITVTNSSNVITITKTNTKSGFLNIRQINDTYRSNAVFPTVAQSAS